MLTIFSTPKPFRGQSNVIQRNALQSWTLLHPNVEVVLFGDEEGTAEACRDLGIRHEPNVRRNENGTKYLNYIFDRAIEMSRHKFLCYANCDIMLMSDFRRALELISKTSSQFLMIGRRWNTNIAQPWNFSQADWERQLRSLALLKGKKSGPSWVDYFCFSRDLFHGNMPPFLVGRHGWDPWLIWFARRCEVSLVDASRMVVAVHQNHDYEYLTHGPAAAKSHDEAKYNWSLGNDSEWHSYTLDAATQLLLQEGLGLNRLAWIGPIKSRLLSKLYGLWSSCLNVTRPIRHRLGLRRRTKITT